MRVSFLENEEPLEYGAILSSASEFGIYQSL